LIAFGALLTLSVQGGIDAYQNHVIHAPTSRRHGQPNVGKIAALGNSVVPKLCAEIGETWKASEGDLPRADLGSWLLALGKIGDPRAVPTLIGMTDHPSWIIRHQAAVAMSYIPDQRCLPALKRLEHDPEQMVRNSASMAIYQYSKREPAPTANGTGK
jgi:hypothetical protein